MTTDRETLAIARAGYDAFVANDRAAMEALVADDFHFTSPFDNRIDRANWFARCWPNSKQITDFEFVHLVADDNQVFVTYEGRGANGRRFRNTEIVSVRSGRIVDVEVYFGWSIPHPAEPGGFVESN